MSASVIICDCLTIRADRGKYYYAADELFERHSDIVKMLCDEAPGLLPTLLSGLIWRSRLTENGSRRVGYHVEHLLVSQDGQFSKALQWIAHCWIGCASTRTSSPAHSGPWQRPAACRL